MDKILAKSKDISAENSIGDATVNQYNPLETKHAVESCPDPFQLLQPASDDGLPVFSGVARGRHSSDEVNLHNPINWQALLKTFSPPVARAPDIPPHTI